MTNPKVVDESSTALSGSHQLLFACLRCVEQCEELLSLISQEAYVESPPEASSVGAHMRHILDRYLCFFVGLESRCIDYDARERDQAVESNLSAAKFALATVRKRIASLQDDYLGENVLNVRETVHHQEPPVSVKSSIERELMGLVTHSTHHLAIIALTVRSLGYQISTDIGKAPSTIVYERS